MRQILQSCPKQSFDVSLMPCMRRKTTDKYCMACIAVAATRFNKRKTASVQNGFRQEALLWQRDCATRLSVQTGVPDIISCGIICVILCLAVLIQYRRVTHTYPHRRTDTRQRHIPRLAQRRALKTVVTHCHQQQDNKLRLKAYTFTRQNNIRSNVFLLSYPVARCLRAQRAILRCATASDQLSQKVADRSPSMFKYCCR